MMTGSRKTGVKRLNEVWLKAAILGTNWAASEIILGSFLHNLHIPFKGNILTAIGLILMISVAYIWRDKGLFWRSGLICALMKTMSPSAVIFGPMVAIFMEALLLELSTRLLGRNFAGFFLGSALAMLWILFQRIINFIIFYGFNIVEIYADLLKYAEKQFNIDFNTFWLPVFILAGAYILFGFFTAVVATGIGRRVRSKEKFELKAPLEDHMFKIKRQTDFRYSIPWLIFSFTGLIIALVIIGRFPPVVWMSLSAVLVTAWVIRYKRAMRQISRPRFWISFAIITILSSLLISYFNGNVNGWKDGFLIGLQMNFRAAVVVVGFAVLSTELYNPVIRNFLAGSAFKQVTVALETAFESLPYVIANLPDARKFLKNPVDVIMLLVHFAESRYNELTGERQPVVFVIKGGIAKGKTSFLIKLVGKLRSENIPAGGIYSLRIMENGETTGYKIVSFVTGEEVLYLRLKTDGSADEIGRWEIIREAVEKGKMMLSDNVLHRKRVIIIDETGKLEIDGKGWSDNIEHLLTKPDITLVISVRKKYADNLIKKFGILNPEIFDVEEPGVEGDVYREIVSSVQKNSNLN